jgi:circadian clock protein KaiC
LVTSHGVRLLPVYVGSGTVLTGSARLSQEAREKAAAVSRQQEAKERRLTLERKRRAVEAQVQALRSQLAEDEAGSEEIAEREASKERVLAQDVVEMTGLRGGRNSRNKQEVSR